MRKMRRYRKFEFGLQTENARLRLIGMSITNEGLYFYAPFREDGLHLSLHADGSAHIKKGNSLPEKLEPWIEPMDTPPDPSTVRREILRLLSREGLLYEPKGQRVLVMVPAFSEQALLMHVGRMLRVKKKTLQFFIDFENTLFHLFELLVRKSHVYEILDYDIPNLLSNIQARRVALVTDNHVILKPILGASSLIGFRIGDRNAIWKLLSVAKGMERMLGFRIIEHAEHFIEKAIQDAHINFSFTTSKFLEERFKQLISIMQQKVRKGLAKP